MHPAATDRTFTDRDRAIARELAGRLRNFGHRGLADQLQSTVDALADQDAVELSDINDLVPENWEMFTAEGDMAITAAVCSWAYELEDLLVRDAIPALDQRLADVERNHSEIHDTEPREHLAVVVKKLLSRWGFDPALSQRSSFAASIWD